MEKRCTALLLLIAMVVSMFPVVSAKPKEADAGTMYIEGLGNVEVMYSGNDNYKIYLDENKNLIVTGEYFTNSTATLSYHTTELYFATRDSGMNPGALSASECYTVDVTNHEVVVAGSTSLDTYTVRRADLEKMIQTLYGKDGLKGEQVVYMSEGFCLKQRPNASIPWNNSHIKTGKVYSSLTEIQGAAGWSQTTKENFAYYYDIQLTLNLTKYSVTVESSEGGTAWSGQEDGMAYEGDTVKLSATAYDDYNFSGWEVVSGNIGSFDTSSANTSFTMPPSDVVVRATFREKEKPPATKAPAPTRSPEATPTPGPTATPLPTAAPTATPIPVPYVETDILERHYTTDAGHYIGKMDEEGEGYFSLKAEDDYGFGYWANQDGVIGGGKITFHGDESYDFGTNGADEWYFIPDGTNATYVHPKKYKGVIVDSENIKNITELTFPETITMNGTEYTVTSIGGGGDLYFGTAWSDTPEHFRYSDGGAYWGESTSITFGVIGNGAYQSYGSQSSSSVDVEYRNNYYFENTTLRYVTIPSTVTRIENYAFYLCQALEQIKGGEGLLSIGDCAFSSLDTVTAYQQSSGVKDINMSLKWYYYNCSKSTSVTPTITAWKTSVSLPHDLYMPTFPKLQLIESEAFCRRSNLSDVFLPNTLQEIESYAFEHCYLDSITIPSVSTVIFDNYDTLGTKGDGVKKKTLIITNPNSKAMEYGLEYELYYDLRAGYAVTYVKNSTPNETYSSNAMLKKQYANAVHTTENAHYTSDDEWQKEVYFLDENGGLFLKKNGTEATPVLSGIKIESLKKCGYLVFAITTSGDVYELFHGATRKLSLPAGAHCFQFVGLENYYRDTLNTYGRGPYLVYFLNADGQICILDNSNRTGIIQGTYPSADTPYKFDRIVVETEGEPYGGFFGELYDEDGDVRSFDLAPQIVAHAASDSPYQPNSLVRFYAKYCGNKDASNVANSYQPPEEITPYSTPCFWIYNAFGYTEHDYYGNELTSYYIGDARYEKMFGGKYTIYRGYEIYFATDTHFCQAKYKLPNTVEMQNTHYPEERNGSYEITQLAEIKYGNAASSDYTVTDHQKTQFSTVEIDGKVYGFVRYKGYMEAATGRMYPIFDGAVKDTWEISGEVTNSEGDRHNYDAVYILGDDDNLYAFYVMETRNYTVYPGYGKVVSNVDKIYKSGDHMFVLDKAGGLWAIGAETWYGPMGHNDAYSSTAPAMEWAFATKIEVTCYCNECKTTETITQFKDVYMETHKQSSWAESSPLNAFHYTLIESACGQTLAAGYNYSIFKDSENHPVFIPVDYAIPAQSSQAYRTGYVFEESLYDLMFDPAGREFVGWTLLADGSGSVYQPGTVLRITAPTSIYAKWDGEAKKKIQYIPNGGAGMMETDVYPADTPNPVTLQKNAFTRKGYEFTGWSYKQNPGSTDTIFRDEAQIVIAPGTTKLYAQWKPFTYTVKVGTEDMRVTGQSFTTHTMQLDTELTLGSKEAKNLTVYFHPNKQTSMSTTPVPNTVMSASASLSFYGWRLYEDTNGDGKILEEDDTYLGFYDAGATVKNLTSKKGMVLYIFPYWGGSASYVDIPEITCTGYDLVGYTPGTALAPDAYETADERAEAIKSGELIMAPVGSNARYQPKTNGETLYAYYEAKTYEVKLSAPNATTHTQTEVEATFDKELPAITPPIRNMYRFMGYYDKLGTDGSPATGAKQYYSEGGYGLLVWEENVIVDTLYAYWVPDRAITYHSNEPDICGIAHTELTDFLAEGVVKPALRNNCFTSPKGYSFVNWNTEADGSGSAYNAGAIVDLTNRFGFYHVYAQWRPHKYNLVFNYADGALTGNKTNPAQATYNKEFSVFKPVYSKHGYKFTGWNIAGTSGYSGVTTKALDTTYKNLTYVDNANVTFTATYAWDSTLSYRIYFHANPLDYQLSAADVKFGAWNANGKSIESADLLMGYFSGNGGTTTGVDAEFGNNYGGAFPTITASGAVFKGWNTKADGSGTYLSTAPRQASPGVFTTSDGAAVVTTVVGAKEDLHLYAIWDESNTLTVTELSSAWQKNDVSVSTVFRSVATGVYRIEQIVKNPAGVLLADSIWYPGSGTTTNLTAEAGKINGVSGYSGKFDKNSRTLSVIYSHEGSYQITANGQSRSVGNKYNVPGAVLTSQTQSFAIDKTKPTFTGITVEQDTIRNHMDELKDGTFSGNLYTSFTLSVHDKKKDNAWSPESDVSGIEKVWIVVSDGVTEKIYPTTPQSGYSKTLYGNHTLSGVYKSANIDLYKEFPAAIALTYTVYAKDYAGNITSDTYSVGSGSVSKVINTDKTLTGELMNFCLYAEFTNTDDDMDKTLGDKYFQAGEFGTAKIWTYGYVESVSLDFGTVNDEALYEIRNGLLAPKYEMNRVITTDTALCLVVTEIKDIRIPVYYPLIKKDDGFVPEEHSVIIYAHKSGHDTEVEDGYIIYDKISNDYHYSLWPLE